MRPACFVPQQSERYEKQPSSARVRSGRHVFESAPVTFFLFASLVALRESKPFFNFAAEKQLEIIGCF